MQNKKPSVGGVWILSGTAQSTYILYTLIKKLQVLSFLNYIYLHVCEIMFKFSFKVGFGIMLFVTLMLGTVGVFGGLRFGEFCYFV